MKITITRDIPKNFIGMVSIIMLVLLAVYFYLPRYARYNALKEKERELDAEIGRLSDELAQLRDERFLLENDLSYLTKVVRERLGRVEPGERVYKIINGVNADESENAVPVSMESTGEAPEVRATDNTQVETASSGINHVDNAND